MDSGSALAIAALLVVAALLWRRFGRHASREAETQLRRVCLGDDAQVERLIDGEMARSPGISRAEAARRAVRRYERDNR